MVLRNAGAQVSDDVERSLRLVHEKLGVTEVWLVAHSDCVAHGSADAAAKAELRRGVAARAQRRPRRHAAAAVPRLRDAGAARAGRATRMSAAPTSAAQPPAISR